MAIKPQTRATQMLRQVMDAKTPKAQSSLLTKLIKHEDDNGLVVHLVPHGPNPALGLEGQNEADRKITRKARAPHVIRTEDQYVDLVDTISEWGYCVESPGEYVFAE